MHSHPSWDNFLVSTTEGGIVLTVAQEELGKRVFLSLLSIGRRGDPSFWKQGFHLGFTATPDPLHLPTEGYFFLLASLEWLQLVLVARKLPASTFHAWVGTSAPARP